MGEGARPVGPNGGGDGVPFILPGANPELIQEGQQVLNQQEANPDLIQQKEQIEGFANAKLQNNPLVNPQNINEHEIRPRIDEAIGEQNEPGAQPGGVVPEEHAEQPNLPEIVHEEQPGLPMEEAEEEDVEVTVRQSNQSVNIETPLVSTASRKEAENYFKDRVNLLAVKSKEGGYDFEVLGAHNMALFLAKAIDVLQAQVRNGIWHIAPHPDNPDHEALRDIEHGAPVRVRINNRNVRLPIEPGKVKRARFSEDAFTAAIQKYKDELDKKILQEKQGRKMDDVSNLPKDAKAGQTTSKTKDERPVGPMTYDKKSKEFLALVLLMDNLIDRKRKREKAEDLRENEKQTIENRVAKDEVLHDEMDREIFQNLTVTHTITYPLKPPEKVRRPYNQT